MVPGEATGGQGGVMVYREARQPGGLASGPAAGSPLAGGERTPWTHERAACCRINLATAAAALATAFPPMSQTAGAVSSQVIAADSRIRMVFAATTNRLRTEGTDHLLAAAEATGVSRIVAQSVAQSFKGARVLTEVDPLDPGTGTMARKLAEGVLHAEDVVVRAGGAALRYGPLYGPGATDDQVELVRKRQFPLVGRGTDLGPAGSVADAWAVSREVNQARRPTD